jgi:hypothetical protein
MARGRIAAKSAEGNETELTGKLAETGESVEQP